MGVGLGFGKILIVGGYSILKKPNRGVVLAVRNAYIRAHAIPSDTWRIRSSYGNWAGTEPDEVPEELRFVKHAILESGVDSPHEIVITESEHFKPGRKLGLGGSSAVTVAVVRALRPDLDDRELFARAYRAHVNAQGKVGSGFDIACAVYGTIVYERPSGPDAQDFVAEPVNVPKDMHLRFYNIVGRGTKTHVSVKKVLNAVKTDPRARDVFDELAELNNTAVELFRRGRTGALLELLGEINALRRELGKLSGVPIEPEDLNPIRKEIEEEGYVTVLPGAGGYDSLLVVGKDPIPPFEFPGLEEVKVWV